MNQTAMAVAMQQAGVTTAPQPSQTEIMWRAVKEATPRGGITVRELIKRLPAINPQSMSSQLVRMERRAMIYSRGTKGYGPKGTAKQYLTDMERYELLPDPEAAKVKKAKAKSRKAGNVPSSAAAPTAAPIPAVKPSDDPVQVIEQLMEHMTLGQLRILHRKLERIFNDKK